MSAKEIWYVWDKKSIINGAKSCVFEGAVIVVGAGQIIHQSIPRIMKGVSLYTLSETRERVECECCEDWNYKGLKCDICKGRGYIWKMGVKA